MIKGNWCFGAKGKFITENGERSFDDTANEAMFYEHKTTYSFKPKKTIKEYVVIKCDVRCPATKDIFSALIKENSDKHIELKERFPKAWEDFVSKGGGFKQETKKEVKIESTLVKKIDTPFVDEVENKDKSIDLTAKMREEYSNLKDKRCKRAFEIRAEFKKANIELENK